MQLESQAVVRTEDGMEVGRVERMVVDPQTTEVTHLVVKKGVFQDDKVVPIGRVDAGTKEGVFLRGDLADVERLPPFEEEHYLQPGGPDGGAAQAERPMILLAAPGYGQPVMPAGLAAPSGRGVVSPAGP